MFKETDSQKLENVRYLKFLLFYNNFKQAKKLKDYLKKKSPNILKGWQKVLLILKDNFFIFFIE